MLRRLRGSELLLGGTTAQRKMHVEAIGDVLRSAATRGARALRTSIRDGLDSNDVQAVVLDGTFDTHFFGAELTRILSRRHRSGKAKPEEGAMRVPPELAGATAPKPEDLAKAQANKA